MKKKLTPEQEALLNKFKSIKESSSRDFESKNEKAQSNAPKPSIRRSGSRGK